MPALRLASVSATIGTNITGYFNGTDEAYIVSANMCNIGNQACAVRLALTDDIIPAADAWMEYDTEIMGHGVLEREGIVIGPGQRLILWSNTSLLSLNVFGFPIGGVGAGQGPIVSNGDFSQPLSVQGDPWAWDEGTVSIVDGVLQLSGTGVISDISQTLLIATGLDYNISFEVVECVYVGGSADANVSFSSGPSTEIITIAPTTSRTVYSVTTTSGANTGLINIVATDAELLIDNISVRRV